MSNDRLTQLLKKLNSGDSTAAEEVFLQYEPYLRMVVRRQLTPRLRAKFDSIDVVQSVWANVLNGMKAGAWRFADEQHLRAFLIKLALNRFVSFYRRHRASLAHEQSLGSLDVESLPVSRADRPSELVEADELWDQLLALSAPSHRELLALKTAGAPLAEIAERTGFHQSSIRRILYQLEDRLEEARGFSYQ